MKLFEGFLEKLYRHWMSNLLLSLKQKKIILFQLNYYSQVKKFYPLHYLNVKRRRKYLLLLWSLIYLVLYVGENIFKWNSITWCKESIQKKVKFYFIYQQIMYLYSYYEMCHKCFIKYSSFLLSYIEVYSKQLFINTLFIAKTLSKFKLC